MDFNSETAWPPLPVDVDRKIREWDAWYAGDVGRLDGHYQRNAGRPARPSQYAGGAVGAVARFFWGQPTPQGQPRSKMHVPLAGDIAGLSSDLLFGEELEVKAAGNEARLREILDGNAADTLWAEAGHACAGLGGVFLRATWDRELAGHALMDVIHTDHVIPEFSRGQLRAATIWEEVYRQGDVVVRYLETHEPGRIRHRLYEGTDRKLGNLVPLDAGRYPQLEGIELTTEDYFTLPPGLLTLTYVPNQRPAPLWRNDPVGRHLGVADINQVEPLLDAIDETWTSWMRDIRHGKSRILVARSMLDVGGAGGGARFDLDREVYEALNFAQGESATFSSMLTPHQFEIRVAEHRDTIHEAMLQAVQSAGYSPYSFGLGDTVGGTTATEVDSRDSKTRRTRERKTRYWTPALSRHLERLSLLDAYLFNKPPATDVEVVFPAGDTETPGEVAQTLQLLTTAQAVSTRTKVEWLHPDWDEAAVSTEVAAILREQGLGETPVPEFDPDAADPFDLPEE